MTASANGNYVPDPAKRRAYLEEIANHREISLHELAGLLTLAEVLGVDEYQTQAAAEPERLLENPVPLILQHSNPEGAAALVNNTTTYDTEGEEDYHKGLEDLILGDETILALRHRTQRGDEQSRAIRARRSVIAFLITHTDQERQNDAAS